MLVNRLPGLSTTTSAPAIASSTGAGAAAPAGSTRTRSTTRPASRTVDSPTLSVPSA